MRRLLLSPLLLLLAAGCDQGTVADVSAAAADASGSAPAARSAATDSVTQTATSPTVGDELVLAGGCFWCMEAAYEQLRGVHEVISGYAGGTRETADYRTVSAGLTDHAEAIRILYDPQVISEQTLLEVFFQAAHDPTQINRQTPDVGRQYRSAVFVTSDEQQQRVADMIAELNASGRFEKPIATTLEPLPAFYPAEDYHQDYVRHHPDEPYVAVHSIPRAEQVRKAFPELVAAD